jgi:hypothetical protein
MEAVFSNCQKPLFRGVVLSINPRRLQTISTSFAYTEVHSVGLTSCPVVAVIYRYPGDIVDHYWFPIKSNSSYVQSTAQVEALTATGIVNVIFPPEAVMNTALTTNGTMTINIPFTHAYIWFMTLYLAELNPNKSNSSREFYVGVPGYSPTWLVNPLVDGRDFGGVYGIEYYGIVPNYVSLFKNQSISTALGPMVNALEIFELSQNQSAMLTNEQDSKLTTQP